MSSFSLFSARSATFALAFIGLTFNATAALNLFRLWNSLKWEPESEWEGSEKYRIDAVRIVWCLLSVYFSLAALACAVGLAGVIKRIPSFVRLYRAYALADLCLCSLSTIAFALASFRPAVRAVICEELSRQADLMRDLAEAGLNVENCESWFQRAVVAAVCLMSVLVIIRLQFTLTISNYYTQLRHSVSHGLPLHVVTHSHTSSAADSVPQRIFLLSNRSNHAQPPSPALLYAPVPLSSLSPEDAGHLDATEVWVVPRHYFVRRMRPDEEPLPPYTADNKH